MYSLICDTNILNDKKDIYLAYWNPSIGTTNEYLDDFSREA